MSAAAIHPARLLHAGDTDPEPIRGDCVIYLMMHAQRAVDNLAFDHAVDVANACDLPLVPVFSFGRGPVENNLRHVTHMLAAFDELIDAAIDRCGAMIVAGYTSPATSEVLAALRPSMVITDVDSMPGARRTRSRIAEAIDAPMVAVDADVVVPQASFDKQEYAARTIRPKIHDQLSACLTEEARDHTPSTTARAETLEPISEMRDVHALTADARGDDVAALVATLRHAAGTQSWSASVDPVTSPSGHRAGMQQLDTFLSDGLAGYDEQRNHPEVDGTSRLSPFLHYGHISAITAARRADDAGGAGAEAFVEEMVVRRELAINFVRHSPHPDSIKCAPDWARETLATHASDPRPAVYEFDDLLDADTIDPLWNAAQIQLMTTGHMHGYMRMYWAKKILEWTPDPADAFDHALTLNDRYSLDGRDPNGNTGVAWAICGIHDRAWPEREVFGKVRSMTFNSTRRKFDSQAYIDRWTGAALF